MDNANIHLDDVSIESKDDINKDEALGVVVFSNPVERG